MAFEPLRPLSSLDKEIRRTYTGLLQQIRIRLDDSDSAIAHIPSGDSEADVLSCERAALQLRKVLELIVLSSLVTNRESLEAVSAAFSNHSATEARKLVRKLNPNYWPAPVSQIPVWEGVSLQSPIKDGFLTEGEWGRAFGVTSDMLHAVYPFRKHPNPAISKDLLVKLSSSIRVLLDEHLVALAGGRKWITGRLDDGTGKAQAGIAELLLRTREPPSADEQPESVD